MVFTPTMDPPDSLMHQVRKDETLLRQFTCGNFSSKSIIWPMAIRSAIVRSPSARDAHPWGQKCFFQYLLKKTFAGNVGNTCTLSSHNTKHRITNKIALLFLLSVNLLIISNERPHHFHTSPRYHSRLNNNRSPRIPSFTALSQNHNKRKITEYN